MLLTIRIVYWYYYENGKIYVLSRLEECDDEDTTNNEDIETIENRL